MRTVGRLLFLVVIATFGTVVEPVGVDAAQVVGVTNVTPGNVPVGTGTVVTVTSRIDDASLLPASVNLQRLDAAGRVLGTLGTLVDTGTGGDAVAGDQVFTVQTTIFETTPGPITLRVSAAFAGRLLRVLSAPVTVTVTGVSTGVAITAPGNLTFLNTSPVRVTGTAAEGATVSVNGVAAAIAAGSFTASVPLQEGINTLTAVATNGGGTATTATVQVTLDTTPPHVTIVAPAAGSSTASATVSVSGMVNDIVVGTVNDEQARVTVNGILAQVANRSFLATNVPLALGPNTLQATATDRSGNAATTQAVVTRVALQTSAVRVVSGDGQTALVGTVLPQPLVVAATDAVGQPAVGVPVTFRVTENSGGLVSGTAQLATVMVPTDARGQASARLALGTRAGVGNNVITASAAGFAGPALFHASGTAAEAAQIVVDTGNGQIGGVGQALPLPFIVIVTDAGHNRLPGVPIVFAMRQGGGSFGGQPYLVATTDGDGRAAAVLTLGQQEGQDNNVVEATFAGNAGNPAAFLASARVPGDSAQTRITGVVLDNSNHAIPGVTMRVFRTNHGPGLPEQVTAPVTTNPQGQFVILPAPVGTYKLMADGSTATNGPWPSIEFDMTTVAGQANDVGLPIYLPALDTVNQVCVTATTGGTLTLPHVPGFALTIAPGSATFPGGSRSGCVTVTPVNGDKSPMSPGFGQQPRFLVTIQPVGTVFNPPAAITLPNVDGLAPRAVTEMYSYDHDLASFVAIGTGTVSEDGLVVRSDPGVGVLKAGWHCGGDPNPTGSAGTCPTCQKCVGTNCQADNSQTPPQNAANDCKKEVCSAGGIVSRIDDTDHDANTCCLLGQVLALQVARPNLTTTSATPTAGSGPHMFAYTATAVSGSNTATYTTDDARISPNVGNIGAPANPSTAPSPGGLAELTVRYMCSSGGTAKKTFRAATFGLSCYIIASEDDFVDADGNCTALTIGGIRYSGTTTNPTGLPAGTYCTAFLHDVVLQGSGQSSGGTNVHYESGGHASPVFSVVTQFTGADNTALIPNGSVARDRSIVPRNTTVQLEAGTFVANDTGGAINGYRLDVFGGFGHGACADFENVISVGACSPGVATCPDLTIP